MRQKYRRGTDKEFVDLGRFQQGIWIRIDCLFVGLFV